MNLDLTNHILAGHGRIEGLMQKKALGESAPQNIIVKPDDWYVPTDRIEIEEEEELACAIALNKIGENEWDNEKTTRILARYASDDNLGGTGFDNDDVDYLLRKTAPQELPQVVSDEELNKYREEKAHWRWLRLRVTEESYDRWLLFRQKSNMQNDDQILDFLLNLVGDDLMEKL